MVKQTFWLNASNAAFQMKAAWQLAQSIIASGISARVDVKQAVMTRSDEQNKRMWAMLGDIAEQVPWSVDGTLQMLEPEEWKHIFTAGLKRSQRVAQGIEGGFVILGTRTSRMSVQEMSDLMELMSSFGAERDVKWSDPEAV